MKRKPAKRAPRIKPDPETVVKVRSTREIIAYREGYTEGFASGHQKANDMHSGERQIREGLEALVRDLRGELKKAMDAKIAIAAILIQGP